VQPKNTDTRNVIRQWARGHRSFTAALLLLVVIGIFMLGKLGLASGNSDAPAPAEDAVVAVRTPGPPPPPAPGSSGVVPVAKPAHVRALYLNAWAAGSARKLQRLIAIANQTEINAFVIDVKEGGEVSYASGVKLARDAGAVRNYIGDVRAMLRLLKQHDIYPIARIVVFKDPVLAKARPVFAVRDRTGALWYDNKKTAWVDSFDKRVWDYNIELAREAVALGFAEVQWDYVRFPDAPRSYLARAVWPAQNGRTKPDGIREFLLYGRERLADLKVPVTADVFGLTVSTKGDMGIGQQWEKMVDAVDVILPMVYPSHFIRGNYGLSNPNAAPYRTIRRSMEDAIARSKLVPNAAIIRPWLQAFTLGPPRYGPAHVRAQIEAVYDAGLTDWVLWSPGSNYNAAALAPHNGAAPRFEIPGGRGGDTGVKQSGVKQESVRKDTVKRDSVRRDTVRRDTVRRDTIRRDTVRRDTIRRDTLRRDTVRRDTVRRDTVRRGTVRRDTVRRDTLLWQPLKPQAPEASRPR
jgi:hypothetical protein